MRPSSTQYSAMSSTNEKRSCAQLCSSDLVCHLLFLSFHRPPVPSSISFSAGNEALTLAETRQSLPNFHSSDRGVDSEPPFHGGSSWDAPFRIQSFEPVTHDLCIKDGSPIKTQRQGAVLKVTSIPGNGNAHNVHMTVGAPRRRAHRDQSPTGPRMA
jgi:hypothetical protein